MVRWRRWRHPACAGSCRQRTGECRVHRRRGCKPFRRLAAALIHVSTTPCIEHTGSRTTGLPDAMSNVIPGGKHQRPSRLAVIVTNALQASDVLGMPRPVTRWNHRPRRAQDVTNAVKEGARSRALPSTRGRSLWRSPTRVQCCLRSRHSFRFSAGRFDAPPTARNALRTDSGRCCPPADIEWQQFACCDSAIAALIGTASFKLV